MGELMETQTGPIPSGVLSFAIGAAIAELKGDLFTKGTGPVEASNTEPTGVFLENCMEELLWKSNMVAWHLAVSDFDLDVIARGPSNLFLADAFFTGDQAACTVQIQGLEGKSKNTDVSSTAWASVFSKLDFRGCLTPAILYSLTESPEAYAIRRMGMILVHDWSSALGEGSTTRGIRDFTLSTIASIRTGIAETVEQEIVLKMDPLSRSRVTIHITKNTQGRPSPIANPSLD